MSKNVEKSSATPKFRIGVSCSASFRWLLYTMLHHVSPCDTSVAKTALVLVRLKQDLSIVETSQCLLRGKMGKISSFQEYDMMMFQKIFNHYFKLMLKNDGEKPVSSIPGSPLKVNG